MGESKTISAFVAGEVSPKFYARTDLSKYDLGVKKALNFFVDYKGGLSNRPGTEFISFFNKDYRMVKFRGFGNDYLVLCTAGNFYFVRNGGLIREASKPVSGLGKVWTSASHGYAVGDLVYIESTPNTIGASVFEIDTVSTNGFRLKSPFGGQVDTTYTEGRVSRIYTTLNPFTDEELPTLTFEQDFDSIVICSLLRTRRLLTYVSDNDWVLTSFAVSNSTPTPVNIVPVASDTGTAGVSYIVTAVKNGVESEGSIAGAINNVVNFSVTTGYVDVTWDPVTDADYYNVYRSNIIPNGPVPSGAAHGFVERTEGVEFVDMNIIPDFTKSPPKLVQPFASGNNPGIYRRFQQRGVYGGTALQPLTIFGSVVGDRNNFSFAIPIAANEAYAHTLDSQSFNPMKHLVVLRNGLLIFTDDNITLLRGEEGKAITPLNAVAEPQAYMQVSSLPPININLDVLFLTSGSTAVYSMLYTEYTQSFKLQDVSVLSNHLFSEDNTIVARGYVSEPYKTLNFIREDGGMAVLTYEREQEVFGWSLMQTKGMYKDIEVIRENRHEAAYYKMRRFFQGTWVWTLERERPRESEIVENYWYVDCGLRNPVDTLDATIYASAETGTITVTASDPVFLNKHVGWAIFLGGGRGTIRNRISDTEIEVDIERDIKDVLPFSDPKVPRPMASGDWQIVKKITVVSGLWHLNGEKVSVLADGDVYMDMEVVGGSITLPVKAGRVTIGLPYCADGETLPATLPQFNLDGKRRNVRGVAVRYSETRGLAFGPDLSDLHELQDRTDEDWGEPIRTQSGLQHEVINTGWNEEGTISWRQKYPLPATVLGLVLEIDVGDV